MTMKHHRLLLLHTILIHLLVSHAALMIPASVRSSLPALYKAPLALLTIAPNAVTGEPELSEAAAGLVELHGIVFAARRPG